MTTEYSSDVETRARVIRPALIVACKSSLSGGVQYQRTQEGRETTEGGAEVKTWHTTKVVQDPAEVEAGTKARSKALYLIRSACAQTPFGLMASIEAEAAVDKGIAAARAIVQAFNEASRTCGLTLHVVKGRIAEGDEAGAEDAIRSEVREALTEATACLLDSDADGARRALDAVDGLEVVLTADMGAALVDAVKEVRVAARAVKKGEPWSCERTLDAIKVHFGG